MITKTCKKVFISWHRKLGENDGEAKAGLFSGSFEKIVNMSMQ